MPRFRLRRCILLYKMISALGGDGDWGFVWRLVAAWLQLATYANMAIEQAIPVSSNCVESEIACNSDGSLACIWWPVFLNAAGEAISVFMLHQLCRVWPNKNMWFAYKRNCFGRWPWPSWHWRWLWRRSLSMKHAVVMTAIVNILILAVAQKPP